MRAEVEDVKETTVGALDPLDAATSLIGESLATTAPLLALAPALAATATLEEGTSWHSCIATKKETK